MKRGSLFSLALTQVALIACQTSPTVARDPSATAISPEVAAPESPEVVTMPEPAARPSEPNVTTEEAASMVVSAPAPAAVQVATPTPIVPAGLTSPTQGPRTTPDGRPAPGNVVGRGRAVR